MSEYTKTEWKNGDVITAEKLNNIEDGITNNSGALVISPENSEQTPDGLKYKEGLSATDLAGAKIVYPANGWTAVAVIKIATYEDEGGTILCETDLSQLPKARYYPDTGLIWPDND